MTLIVNSESRAMPEPATVAGLLTSLGLPATRAAVEVNGVLVRRVDHAATALHPGDRVEVVTLVGGG